MQQSQPDITLTRWQQMEDRLYEGVLRPDKFGGLGALLIPGGMIISARKEARDDRINPIKYPVTSEFQREALRIVKKGNQEQIYILAGGIEALKALVYAAVAYNL